MNLEQQVVSLELAKKLKELGVKQESLYKWVKVDMEDGFHLALWRNQKEFDSNEEEYIGVGISSYSNIEIEESNLDYSAFTIAELGEIMNIELCDQNEDNSCTLKCSSGIDFWAVSFGNDEMDCTPQFEDISMPDAFAKMLIHLLENNLINPQ